MPVSSRALSRRAARLSERLEALPDMVEKKLRRRQPESVFEAELGTDIKAVA